MKFLFILFLTVSFFLAEGQTYNIMTENGNTVVTCSGTFTDSNVGSFGKYGDNENYTVTFCSSSGNPLRFNFTDFGMAAGDALYVYDGVGTSGALITVLDNSDDFSFSQLGLATTSDCVTFNFISNSSGVDAGWSATISCTAPPPDCNGNPAAADIFSQATYICNLNGYCGNTSSYYMEDRPANLTGGGDCPAPSDNLFGGTLENNSWLQFQAGSTTVDLDFVVSNCAGDGIQVGVFYFDGTNFLRVSACNLTDGSWGGAFTVSASGLTVGETYYIMVDGNAGSVCDYTIYTDENDVTVVDAGNDQTICNGDDVTLTATAPGTGNTYVWTWNNGAGGPVVGASQTFSPTVTTEYIVTVNGTCQDVTDTIVVTVDDCTPDPCFADAGAGFILDCTTSSVTLDGSGSSAGAEYSYSWSTAGGNIVSGGTTTSPVVNAAGTYTILVTNSANGCTASDVVTVTQDASLPTASAGVDQVLN
ncbi:MAG: hypothetical protein JXR58_00595, partial [Bacteroidales bacterium]|nr:hypothetical protein [Bacteroidales bacterium]